MEGKLQRLKITVVGCGALGSAVLQILGRWGAGTMVIIDGDIVTPKNASMQPAYTLADTIGINYKSDVMKLKLEDADSSTVFRSLPFYLTEDNAESALEGSDLVIDATDNLKSRLLINRSCVRLDIPLLEVMARNDEAMVHLVYGDNACLDCLHFSSKPEDSRCESVDTAVSYMAAGIAASLVRSFFAEECPDLRTAVISSKKAAVQRVSISRLDACETCSKRMFKRERDDRFLQICGDGIKYSFSRKVMLHNIYLKLSEYGEVEGDNNYILLRRGSRSVLISNYGDLLFTGYDVEEAKAFVEDVAPLFLVP